ncbi:MAG: HlyD family efflux transporter periplasmic adaptor subunit [Sphingobacteriales bacterium]|nr:HlyD family efflux transporter periplasmic adaptor subunit [Sphingobacteriales bacterium]
MKNNILKFLTIAFIITSCNRNAHDFDASGTFEAEEVIVSSEATGRLISFDIEEGQSIAAGKKIGLIDAENLTLQKEQIEASIKALSEKTADVNPQIQLLQNQQAVQQSQLKTLYVEKVRVLNLLKMDAATRKQLDDINAQIDVIQKQMAVTKQQINVQRSATSTQNRGILSEGKPLQKRVEQLNDQLKRATIVNPVNGTVLTKYAEQGEITSAGKALYKIADLSTLTLRAYITGAQLSQVKINQQVTVRVDKGADDYKTLKGTITWISDKAEFTPKTIQTKDERSNLVYATKIRVKNDGYLKLGMYGEVIWSSQL